MALSTQKNENKGIPRYPDQRRDRKHGPVGYTDYTSYKEWLRDEFVFQCAYCLVRERWCHDGHRQFSVDHVIPVDVDEELECVYENLCYSCVWCNSLKGAETFINDPLETPLGNHLRLKRDGTIDGITAYGKRIVAQLQLNEGERVRYRKGILDSISVQAGEQCVANRRRLLGFPSKLPDLARLNPESNSRLAGLEVSFHRQHGNGLLPEQYLSY